MVVFRLVSVQTSQNGMFSIQDEPPMSFLPMLRTMARLSLRKTSSPEKKNALTHESPSQRVSGGFLVSDL